MPARTGDKRCDCYSIVRKDFLDSVNRLMESEASYPNSVALDRLRAIEVIDTQLFIEACISPAEIQRRREVTGDLIEKAKSKIRYEEEYRFRPETEAFG